MTGAGLVVDGGITAQKGLRASILLKKWRSGPLSARDSLSLARNEWPGSSHPGHPAFAVGMAVHAP
jgi:hypothetical protein